jgi:hypothetical protein
MFTVQAPTQAETATVSLQCSEYYYYCLAKFSYYFCVELLSEKTHVFLLHKILLSIATGHAQTLEMKLQGSSEIKD